MHFVILNREQEGTAAQNNAVIQGKSAKLAPPPCTQEFSIPPCTWLLLYIFLIGTVSPHLSPPPSYSTRMFLHQKMTTKSHRNF